MDYLSKLSKEEKEKLKKAPVWFILFSVLKECELEDCDLSEAVDIVHIRTFSAADILKDYYRYIDKHFEKTLEEEIASLPKSCKRKLAVLKSNIESLKYIFQKLDPDFAIALIDSFYTLSKFVVMSNKNPLESIRFFVFPDTFEKKI